MKKTDLKTRMIIELSDKKRRVVLLNTRDGDTTCKSGFYRDGSVERLYDFFGLDHWNEDLTSNTKSIVEDVIKVYSQYGSLLWEKKEKELKLHTWYKHQAGGYWFILELPGRNRIEICGTSYNNTWHFGKNIVDKNHCFDLLTEATQKEIDALIEKECKLRYLLNDEPILFSNGSAFMNGEWAESKEKIEWSRLPLIQFNKSGGSFLVTVQSTKDKNEGEFEGIVTGRRSDKNYEIGFSTDTWSKSWEDKKVLSYMLPKK